MERYTKRDPATQNAWVNAEQLQEALNRLALFEDLFDETKASQQTIAAQLEELRSAGKKNSTQFKELLGKKLTNSHMLLMWEMKGLK